MSTIKFLSNTNVNRLLDIISLIITVLNYQSKVLRDNLVSSATTICMMHCIYLFRYDRNNFSKKSVTYSTSFHSTLQECPKMFSRSGKPQDHSCFQWNQCHLLVALSESYWLWNRKHWLCHKENILPVGQTHYQNPLRMGIHELSK